MITWSSRNAYIPLSLVSNSTTFFRSFSRHLRGRDLKSQVNRIPTVFKQIKPLYRGLSLQQYRPPNRVVHTPFMLAILSTHTMSSSPRSPLGVLRHFRAIKKAERSSLTASIAPIPIALTLTAPTSTTSILTIFTLITTARPKPSLQSQNDCKPDSI